MAPTSVAAIDPRLYEDIGALKATIAAVDRRLDAGTAEFTLLRNELGTMLKRMTEIHAANEVRGEAVDRMEESVQKLEKRVDELVRLRHQVGGAMFLLSAIGGTLCIVIYQVWSGLKDYLLHFLK